MSALNRRAGKDLSAQLAQSIDTYWPRISETLSQMVRIASSGGKEAELVHYVADWAKNNGLATDVFEIEQVPPAAVLGAATAPTPLTGRPTLVMRWPGRGQDRSLVFNAHSDVVPAPEPHRWRFGGPWSGAIEKGRLHGRGACDDKGPLASAMLAILALRQTMANRLSSDILLELVPGEEEGVGRGTWTSVARGYHASAAVILEPTDGLPRCASRGGLRFRITVTGQAIHGTVKWLGRDAIRALRSVLESLERMESEFQEIDPDPLFKSYPLQRPITVDRIEGGAGQGMVCDEATAQGYFELLPRDDADVWKEKFREKLDGHIRKMGWFSDDIRVEFVEQYGGHITMPEHPLCRIAERIARAPGGTTAWDGWKAFNSGCEAGLRWRLDRTPTLVWGPGHLPQAHAVDEFVDLADVRDAALQLALLAYHWTQGMESC